MSSELVSVIVSSVVSIVTTAIVLVLALGEYKNKVDRSEKDIEKHSFKLDDVSDRISRLEGGVDRDRAYFKSQSPVSLTDRGKLVLFESGGKQYIDHGLPGLIKIIKTKGPKTAYDVQEMVKDVITKKQNDDEFIPMKNYAFKEGITIELVIDIMSIYLRDEVLESLGFSLADIDKTAPA